MNFLRGALLGAILTTSAALAIDGRVTTKMGYDTNPSGVATGSDEATGTSTVTLSHTTDAFPGTLKWQYTGQVAAYAPSTRWSVYSHKVGATYFQSLGNFSLSGGGFVAYNGNSQTYSDYNSQTVGLEGDLSTKIGKWTAGSGVELSRTTNSKSSALSYLSYSLSVSAHRTFSTRTTILARAEFEGRSYESQALGWSLGDYTSTRSTKLKLWLRTTQGLAKTLGLRSDIWYDLGSGDPWRIDPWSDLWLTASDPLASTSKGLSMQLSWLGPLGLTYKVSGQQRWRDKAGSEQIDQPLLSTGLEPRSDRITSATLSVDGLIPLWLLASRPLGWNIGLNYTRQNSSNADYTYDRTALTAGLQYAW